MKFKKVFVALLGSTLVGGSALAATSVSIGSIEGSVSLARNGVLKPATAGALEQGDRVVARDGSATLTYADGCVVDLAANAMAVVGASSPCASGEGLIRASESPSAQGFSNMTAGQAIGVGLVTVLTLYGISEGLDDDPVSP
jgi:hypothetical protein